MKRNLRRRRASATSAVSDEAVISSHRTSAAEPLRLRAIADKHGSATASNSVNTAGSLLEMVRPENSSESGRCCGFHCIELLRVKYRKNGANWKIENSCRFHLQSSRKEHITEQENTRQADNRLRARISSRMEQRTSRTSASRTSVLLTYRTSTQPQMH